MDKRKNMLPDFIAVGTYRAGTTWLHHILQQHEEVCVSEEKEIMYYSHHYQKGVDWYKSFFFKDFRSFKSFFLVFVFLPFLQGRHSCCFLVFLAVVFFTDFAVFAGLAVFAGFSTGRLLTRTSFV